jgi:hypothetical protein
MSAEKAKFWVQIALDNLSCSVFLRVDGLKEDRRESSDRIKRALNEAMAELNNHLDGKERSNE